MRSSRNHRSRYYKRKRYNRNIFDPQNMYQHPITRTQAKGVVLQPKVQNLEEILPRVNQELLQKYYDICLAYNIDFYDFVMNA